MTPDEIRVAIRLLNQIVVYDEKYPVTYDGQYNVNYPYNSRELFGKDGNFKKSWVGGNLWNRHLFKVVDRLPDPPKRRKRTVARK